MRRHHTSMRARRSVPQRRDERGAVTIEMVLAIPALLTLIIGAVVLGNFLSIKTQTAGLARDGARAAALRQPLPADTVIVGAACPSSGLDALDAYVTVQATKTVNLRGIPFLPTVLPASTSETVTMRCGG